MRRWLQTPVLLLAVTPALAGSAERIFQARINEAGNDCPSVTTAQAIGTDSSGNALIAVACSNGDRHVVKIGEGNRVEYISSCGLFQSYTGTDCF